MEHFPFEPPYPLSPLHCLLTIVHPLLLTPEVSDKSSSPILLQWLWYIHQSWPWCLSDSLTRCGSFGLWLLIRCWSSTIKVLDCILEINDLRLDIYLKFSRCRQRSYAPKFSTQLMTYSPLRRRWHERSLLHLDDYSSFPWGNTIVPSKHIGKARGSVSFHFCFETNSS